MSRRHWPISLILFVILAFPGTARAQVFSNRTRKPEEVAADTTKPAPYPYVLPIWGAKATAKGYTLPYSAGFSTQYFGQNSDLRIDNLMVGFNNGPLYDLDGLIRFDKARSQSDGLSLRPDIWILPFLNVYGIFGVSKASTDVGYGLWLPDSSGADQEVVHLDSKVDFTATTLGFGLTPTIGVRGAWVAFDMNFTWTDVPQLNEPAQAFVFDPRIGKSFRLRRPDENINVWVGGFRFQIDAGTTGSIPLGDALPIDQWQMLVTQGEAKVEQYSQEIETWWNGLSQAEQMNPLNRARYEAAMAAIARASAFLVNADNAVDNASKSTVQYSLDKRPEDLWNFLVGTQYQLNRSWMFRAEVGFLTSRTQLIAGVQYRFGL